MSAQPAFHTDDLPAAYLRGQSVRWSEFAMTATQFVARCQAMGLTGLVAERLSSGPECQDWPQDVCRTMTSAARVQAVEELLRHRQIGLVLDELARNGIPGVILKGSALAYSVYDNPSSRPRADTDILVRREDRDRVRRAMARLGYEEPPRCDGELVSRQFAMIRCDEFGVWHQWDVHWAISNRSAFAGLLSFEEITAAALPLPRLSPHAVGAGLVHALLIACVHPAMHHGNVEWPLWSYDVHLLASRLSPQHWRTFADLAYSRQVAAVCLHQLNVARRWFGTIIPEFVLERLVPADGEATAAFLRNRSVLAEALLDIRALPRHRDRLQFVREALFPSRAYMLSAYGAQGSPAATVLLPLLYLHRVAAGALKALKAST